MADRLAQRLAALFQGRVDAWGAEHGECVKQPLGVVEWWHHTFGDGSVGVYPLCPRIGRDSYGAMHGPAAEVDEWVVHWGCVDIDDGYDAGLVTARNLHTAYKTLGLTSWIERTKGKGYHTWVFCDGWVPAVQMRAVQILACTLIDYTPKEINPKQVTLTEGSLGNYVNAAYAKKWAEVGKRVVTCFADGIGWWDMRLDEFLDAAERTLNTVSKIAEVAALYREPPPKVKVVFDTPAPYLGRPLAGVARAMMEDGPFPSILTGRIDRSAALARMAHLLKADGYTPGNALALVKFFDTRPDMQKYVDRKDAELQYERIVEHAYGS